MRAMVRGAHFLAVAAMSAVGAAPGAVDEGLLASYALLHADCAVEGTPTEPPSPLKGVVDEAAAQEQSKRAGEWSTPPPVPPKPKKSSLCAVL